MALISKLVPRSHLTNAVSLNSSVSQAAHFIGPMIAGVSLEWMDIGNSYLFNALFYLPAAASIILIHTSGAPDGKKEPFSVGSFLGGLRFLFSEPIVLAMVILDFIVAGVGYYRPLLPIFAKDILYVGPAGFGILSSAPAVGGIGPSSCSDRRRGAQRTFGALVVSLLRRRCRPLRNIHELLAVGLSAGNPRAREFIASGYASNHLSSSNTGPGSRPGFRCL
jgi:hypothetical protein